MFVLHNSKQKEIFFSVFFVFITITQKFIFTYITYIPTEVLIISGLIYVDNFWGYVGNLLYLHFSLVFYVFGL